MLTFIVRRLFAVAGLLLVVAFVTMVIFYEMPRWGGQTPAAMAVQYVGKQPSPAAIQGVVHRFGFDRPLPVQYLDYVRTIFTGTTFSDGTQDIACNAPCLGYSFRNYQQVWPTILSDLPVTFSIAAGAGVLWLFLGVASGLASAVRKGSLLDRASMVTALLGISLPVYFLAPLLSLPLAYRWSILPAPGSYVGILTDPGQWFLDMILPWTCLAFGLAALYTRLTRAGMLDVLSEDFVRTARAKGLTERRVILKHALRAAITPIITIFGMDFATVLGGAVLVEITFSLKGIGFLAITSIQNGDFPMMMGVTLFAAAFIVLANLLVDVLYAVADPRVRL